MALKNIPLKLFLMVNLKNMRVNFSLLQQSLKNGSNNTFG
jgi:triacylglycerol esterase/lipase EstA (alpha/beta hydrolase family)